MLLPDILKNRLSRRQCVVFIGAGFSMPCGMPNWTRLLYELVEDAKASQVGTNKRLSYCEKAIKGQEYALIASILRDVMPANDLDEAIRKKFSMEVYHKLDETTKLRMNKRLENLVSAPWAGIITTNYDELIEYALGRYNFRDFVQTYGNDPALGSILSSPMPAGSFFVKLHGSIIGGDYVLGTEEYDRTYINTPQVSSFLTALMLRYNIVFVGCSLEDEILRIRRRLCHDFSGRIPTAYALLPETNSNNARKQWLKQYVQIEPLLYKEKLRGRPAHFSVDSFLEEAANCTDYITDHDNNEITLSYAKISLAKRLESIGAINRELLRMICNASKDYSIPHIHLQNLDLLDNAKVQQIVRDISPDERIYRVLFLKSIGLVTIKKLKDGTNIYKVSSKVVDLLRKHE